MKSQRVHKLNAAVIPFLASETEGSINRRFQLVVRAVPDQIAVNAIDDRLTYAQLDGMSDRIAQAILSCPGLTEKAPVAILIEQGHLVMAAILGILKTGRGFIVLPPDSPLERLKRLWEDAMNPLILTSRQFLHMTQCVVSSEKIWLVIDDLTCSEEGAETVSPEPGPDDLAVISYTSGSTGEPKGVMWSHRLVLHTAFQNQASYRITPQDRCSVLASFGFGAGMTQCFAALLSGATLYLPDLKQSNISTLIEWLRKEEITVLAMPPIGLFRQLLSGLKDGLPLPWVRLILLGGDDLYKQDLNHFRDCFGSDVILAYRLAGSETMLIREIQIGSEMQFFTEKIPVGYSVPDKEIMLLNESRNEVPPGQVGEIIVRSRYLALGYWNQPAMTDARFQPDPAGSDMKIYLSGDLARIDSAGQMEHLGRKDLMVKVHGFSVQLEAIDTAIKELTFVRDAATMAYPLPGGDKRLIAYLVPSNDQKPSVGEVRKALADHLPDYLLPSGFVWMENLPRTSTGKVDRQALPPPPRTRPDVKTPLVLPHSRLEETLAGVWGEVLQLDQVGVEDNFFEIGGDSLLSVQMILDVERLVDLRVPSVYFQKPTITHLVEILQQETETGGTSLPQNAQPHRTKRLLSRNRISNIRSVVNRFVAKQLSPAFILKRTQQLIIDAIQENLERPFRGKILNQPYGLGCHQLFRWTSRPLVSSVYRVQYGMFQRMLAELDECTVDPTVVFAENLTGNIFLRLLQKTLEEDDTVRLIDRFRTSPHPFWRSLAQMIDEAPFSELDRYFSVSGIEHLERAHRKSRGVILLTYHSTVNRLAIAALPRRLDGEYIQTISQKIARQLSPDWWKNRRRKIPEVEQVALFAGIALQGQHLLEQGKIIQFVSDKEYNQEGYPVIIGGRQYHLKSGFADLACNSGAEVVPQYSTILPDGRIHTAFQPPLVHGVGGRDSQISTLLDQYADFINASWRIAPESIKWARIRNHFRQPRADENDK